MNENERKCDFKIVAFVNGKRQDIICNQETGCLSKLAWCGIGVNRAAALVLGRSVKGVEAYVDGDCEGRTSSDSPKR
jgi:hypothetical protein